jgi:membrane fusion protein, multidrug efflux system
MILSLVSTKQMISMRCCDGARRSALAWCMLAAILTGCSDEAPAPELPPRAILWQRISGENVDERRVISGIVTAVSDTRLAFEVGGIVESVEVSLGDRVENGQVLARLDPEPFELAVRDADAALAEALALRESARADFSRAEQLFEANVMSRQEYERATARRDSQDSHVDAAEARLNLTRRDLRRSVLRAPFAGAISVKEIDLAMKLSSGQIAFEMDSGESGLRIEVQMPETLIARVKQGDAVSVTFPSVGDQQVDAAGRSYPAVIAEVGTRAGTGNAFPVRADLVEAPSGLRPGMTAEATFTMSHEGRGIAEVDGFLIPIAAALAESNGQFAVFVFDPSTSTVSKRSIQSGGVRDNSIAVLGGLTQGDIIATAGVTFLREGQTVTLVDERLVRSAP